MFRRGAAAAIGALALIAGGLLSPRSAQADALTAVAPGPVGPVAARADDGPLSTAPRGVSLIVQVKVNGVDTGSVLQFEDRDGEISAPRATLQTLGLRLSDGLPQDAAGAIRLAALEGVAYQLDGQSQTLSITAQPQAMVPHQLFGAAQPVPRPDPASWGAALNYGVYAVAAQGAPTQASLIAEGRLFGPLGVLSMSFTARHAPGDVNDGVRRLDTTYEFDDYDRARVLQVGDFISASLPWTASVRAAGVSYSTDFSLRPDIITQPLPQVRGASGVPSTVDLFVDGAKRATTAAPAGPFSIDATPMVDGQGRLTVVVTDALGRQTTQTLDFYSASELLRKGTTAFAFEAGAFRENYATDQDRYTDVFAAGTARRGLTDTLTAEGHSAISGRIQTIGAGLVATVDGAALVSTAVNVSHSPQGDGLEVYASARRDAGPYSLFAAGRWNSSDFVEAGQTAGGPILRAQVLAGAAFRTRNAGAFAMTFSEQRTDRGDVRIANASWSRGFGRFGLNASVLTTFGQRDATVFSLGLTAAFGGRSTSALATARSGQATLTADVSQAAPTAGGWGWRLDGQGAVGDGGGSQLEADVHHDSAVGEVGVGVSAFNGAAAGRLYGSGALVWMGGRPRAAAQVGEGFALVETGQPDVGVTVENRPVGRTGPDGRLLIAQLSPLAASRIALQPETVSLDQTIETQVRAVRPPRGEGVVVALPVRRLAAAMVRLVDPQGAPVPVGLTARLNGQDAGVTGFDGQIFLTGLTAENVLDIFDQTGACRVEVPYVATPGAPRLLGPFVCRLRPADELRDNPVRLADASARVPELRGPDRGGGLRDLRPGGAAERRHDGLRGDEVHVHRPGLLGLWLQHWARLRGLGQRQRPTLAQDGPDQRGDHVRPLS